MPRPRIRSCDNGFDDDGDGVADWLDAKCQRDWPYWEITPACGIGAELALLLPLGAAWRRRAYFSSKSAR